MTLNHYVCVFIFQDVCRSANEKFGNDANQKAIQCYIDTCMELCWLMVIQDPPVHIDTAISVNSKVEFNKHKYKAYTTTGRYIDYIVWPVLQLHERGSMLCKGVAQGGDGLSYTIGHQSIYSKEYKTERLSLTNPLQPRTRLSNDSPVPNQAFTAGSRVSNQNQTSTKGPLKDSTNDSPVDPVRRQATNVILKTAINTNNDGAAKSTMTDVYTAQEPSATQYRANDKKLKPSVNKSTDKTYPGNKVDLKAPDTRL